MIVSLIKYSSLSNNRAGWNKHAGCKIPPNFDNFGDTEFLNVHLIK